MIQSLQYRIVTKRRHYIEDRRCAMTIRTNGPADHWEWEGFYQQATAVVGMCARGGMEGAALRLGKLLTTSIDLVPINKCRCS